MYKKTTISLTITKWNKIFSLKSSRKNSEWNAQHQLHLFLDFFLPHHHRNNCLFQLICNDITFMSSCCDVFIYETAIFPELLEKFCSNKVPPSSVQQVNPIEVLNKIHSHTTTGKQLKLMDSNLQWENLPLRLQCYYCGLLLHHHRPIHHDWRLQQHTMISISNGTQHLMFLNQVLITAD